jgi:hypothetical protein
MKEDIITLDYLALSLIQGGLSPDEIATLQQQAAALMSQSSGMSGPEGAMTCGQVMIAGHCSPDCLTGPGKGGAILRSLAGSAAPAK